MVGVYRIVVSIKFFVICTCGDRHEVSELMCYSSVLVSICVALCESIIVG